jgi:putative spermidine/putrescine transport system substrate-binding protein
MTNPSRRSLIKSALLGGLGVGLTRADIANKARAATGNFRVGTWGGSWKDSIATNITAKAGLQDTTEYILGNPDENLAKLIAAHRGGQIPFDVMECDPDQTPLLNKSGLFAALDYTKLPNAAGIPAWARTRFLVSTLATEDGIVYNAEKLKGAGIEPPRRYTDLKDKRLAGKVAFPDISNPQHWNAVVGLAMEGGGSESNLVPAIKLVNEIKPAYFFSASTELATRFGSGDIWAAAWHVGWAVRLKRSGIPVAMAYPHFGTKVGALYVISIAMIKGTPDPADSYAFIDEYLAPAAQSAHGTATGSLPLVASAREELAKNPINNELMMLGDAQVNNMFQIDWTRLDVRKWHQEWNRGINR